ncbi:STAS domain-containing protein [Streptomyces sp. V4-01]|uniref:STAS domain-containing protein n=1 Tax=Actinacidiphila polyblastidii TaxID=3110430 RepID=A0ABU7PCV3_9ACTN|nr:STAS domain-containing protein [Streptomyces sp. V4-01]
MVITTTNDGVTAVISPRGEIDFEALPDLLAAARDLPQSVTQVTWDFQGAAFMDVAGLHLLVQQRLDCIVTKRTLAVTGLRQQPLRLLRLAEELFPAGRWADLLRGSLPVSTG